MAQVRVTQDWQASYADPIRVARGAPLILDGRSDDWQGHRWLWAIALDGRAGWVPDDLPEPDGPGGHRARRDYSALELTCHAGEVLEVLGVTHGWTLCRAADGHRGWVPDDHLTPVT